MYRCLLVPLDGSEHSEQAIPYAQMLSQNLRIPVELMLAFIPASAMWARGLLGGMSTSVAEIAVEQEGGGSRKSAEEYLESLADPLRRQGIEVRTKAAPGDPPTVVAQEAQEVAPSLIVMSTHGRSGLDRWLMGSIADKVVRNTHQPVLLVPLGEEERVKTTRLEVVILPLDGSPLAEQVLPHVAALARAFPLRVVPLWVGTRREGSSLPAVAVSAVATSADAPSSPGDRDMEAEVDSYFQEIAARLGEMGVSQVTPEVRNNDVAGTILDFAQETPNSLTALTSHGRSGIGRWIMGSVSDRVVGNAREPVLIIRAQEAQET